MLSFVVIIVRNISIPYKSKEMQRKIVHSMYPNVKIKMIQITKINDNKIFKVAMNRCFLYHFKLRLKFNVRNLREMQNRKYSKFEFDSNSGLLKLKRIVLIYQKIPLKKEESISPMTLYYIEACNYLCTHI